LTWIQWHIAVERSREDGHRRPYANDNQLSHGPKPDAYRGLRHRAANRLDHVTLTPGATALAVATDTLWVPSGTKANLAPQHRMGGLRMSMSRKEFNRQDAPKRFANRL
jgi:hypothetical protein